MLSQKLISMQMFFYVLLSLRVVVPRLTAVADVDNPDEGFLTDFTPANASILTKTTQFMCLISYCVFAGESVKDSK